MKKDLSKKEFDLVYEGFFEKEQEPEPQIDVERAIEVINHITGNDEENKKLFWDSAKKIYEKRLYDDELTAKSIVYNLYNFPYRKDVLWNLARYMVEELKKHITKEDPIKR